jgi:hypothetical protein
MTAQLLGFFAPPPYNGDDGMMWSKYRLAGLATALLSLGGMQTALAQRAPRAMAPEQAPASWIAYAEKVHGGVTRWLTGSDAAAVKFRIALDAARPAPDQPGVPLMLRLWISPRGVIDRVENDPLGVPEGDIALGTLLVGKAIGSAPPRRMLLPLRLRIQLDVAPSPTAEAPTSI